MFIKQFDDVNDEMCDKINVKKKKKKKSVLVRVSFSRIRTFM